MARTFEDGFNNGNYEAWSAIQAFDAQNVSTVGYSTGLDKRVHLVTSPTREGTYAHRTELREGEAWGGDVLRSDIYQFHDVVYDVPAGGSLENLEYWHAHSIYFPDVSATERYNWNPNTSFNTMINLHTRSSSWPAGIFDSHINAQRNGTTYGGGALGPEWSGKVFFEMTFEGGDIDDTRNNWPARSSARPIFPLTDSNGVRDPAQFNVWHDIMIHVKFNSTGSIGNSPGFFEVFHARRGEAFTNPVPLFYRPSIYTFADGPERPHLKLASYTTGGADLGTDNRSAFYYDRVLVGTTRADVEPTATPPVTPGVTAFGKRTIGTSKLALKKDYKYASGFTLPEAGTVSSVWVYLEGGTGSAAQSATVRGFLYTAGADGGPATLPTDAFSPAQTIAGNRAAGWVQFPLTAGYAAVAGKYWLGVSVGGTDGAVSLYADTLAQGMRTKAELYPASAGPATAW